MRFSHTKQKESTRRLHEYEDEGHGDDDNDTDFKMKHISDPHMKEMEVCDHGCDRSTAVAEEIARSIGGMPHNIIEFFQNERHNPDSITPAKARAFMMMHDRDVPLRYDEHGSRATKSSKNSVAVVNFFGDDSVNKDPMKYLHLLLPKLSKFQGEWTEPTRYKGGYAVDSEVANEGEAPMDRELIQVTGIGVPLQLWVRYA